MDSITGVIKELDRDGDQQAVLSHLAYYYPKLRNLANVTLLTDHVLASWLFQGDKYKILELFKYVSDTKFRVSVPSVPFAAWYAAILDSLSRNERTSWKSIPVLAGLLLSIDSRGEYDVFPPNYTAIRALDKRATRMFERELLKFYGSELYGVEELVGVVNVCVACNLDRLADGFFARLPANLVATVVGQTFVDVGDEMSPNTKHLSRLAQFAQKLILFGDGHMLNSLDVSINSMYAYSERHTGDKNGYYATIVVAQAIFTKFFELDPRVAGAHFHRFSRKLMMCLYQQHFVLCRIGSGGFDSYNFVLNCCVDGVKTDRETVRLVLQILVSGVDFTRLTAHSEIEQGKMLFGVEIMGRLVNSVPFAERERILAFVDDILAEKTFAFDEPRFWKPVVEACHSVKLIFYNIVFQPEMCDRDVEVIRRTVIPYSQLLLGHCPALLSVEQLQIAVVNLATCVSSAAIYSIDPTYSKLLTNLMFNKCVALPESQFKIDLTTCFISMIPLVPVENLTKWIDITLRELIVPVRPKIWKRQLVERLWDEILNCNKVDSQKGNVAIAWWYDNVNGNDRLKL